MMIKTENLYLIAVCDIAINSNSSNINVNEESTKYLLAHKDKSVPVFTDVFTKKQFYSLSLIEKYFSTEGEDKAVINYTEMDFNSEYVSEDYCESIIEEVNSISNTLDEKILK